jgi:MFS superfamily sulfate permease-like transporter
MSIVVPPRGGRSLSPLAGKTQPAIASLVVHLHRDEQRCIASFSGSLAGTTGVTIDGVADLISGEESVLLDFSRADLVDQGGVDALETLILSIRQKGARLQVVQPRNRRGKSLSCRRGDDRRSPTLHLERDR